ncbi:ABC-type transport system, substrate-binding protein [Haladaptatus litoreus]|uniref:ABC-type transport system, substrate-binding protein n=1 Tax=Haladaptatus litoreus TaxID=553468 RepID=A0A1N7DFZ9_9EURY|nr:ABC transporter substrate-binding protein [Haladaptatus litoreus]SIR74738.1 ABC-type transport system, substrate-binding protein [Haladaptatus litoreus]
MAKSSKPHSATNIAENLSRRQLLAVSSAAAAGGLAGCSGSDNDNKDGGAVMESGIDTWISRLPTRMTWNPWATNYPWTTAWIVCEPVVRFFADGSVKTSMLDDWSYDANNQVTTIKFQKNWHWWNGKPVKAADKYYFEELARLMDPEGSDLKKLEMPDEYTLKRYHKDPQNPQILKYNLGGYLGTNVRGFRETYKPWVEKFQDVSKQSEREKLKEDLARDVKIPTKDVIEKGLGTGPFELTKADSQKMVLEKFDKHPYADEINISKLQLNVAKEQSLAQRIKDDKLDLGFGLRSEWVEKGIGPEHIKNVGVFRDTFMKKINFGLIGDGAKHVRKRRVRQAIACAINTENLVTNIGGKNYTLDTQSGLTPAVAKKWVGEDQLNKYIKYPAKDDQSRASKLMRDAGYSKNSGTWTDSDGDKATIEFAVETRYATHGKTLKDQLQQFGFNVNFMTLSSNNFSSKYNETPTYDMTIDSHGALQGHPYYYFRTDHQFGNELGETGAVKRWLEQGKARSEFIGRKLKPEVPKKVGAEDLSGATERINLFKLFQNWKSVQTDEENQRIAKKLSWYWNFHLPQIDLYQSASGSWGDTKNFKFENTGSKDWKAYRACYFNVKRGNIKAKKKK